MELDRTRAMKCRAGQGPRRAIRPLRFTLLETFGAGQKQMHVHELVSMRSEQRAKTRTHAARIQHDAAPFAARLLEAAMQFRKHLRAASALLMRERKPDIVGAQVQRRALSCDT